ncbi:hypothetical protein HK405_006828 [Cladochytrium tenue]|nr:hypothetical protein HK405_006828 [Cladochytrium tenue]
MPTPAAPSKTDVPPPGLYHPLVEVAPGFYTLKTDFKIYGINIGSHMNFLRLSTGKFLVVDTVELDAASRAAVDKLTDNGALMEAVVATHPFHSLFFKPFQAVYPNPPYYGCPRHIRKCEGVTWAGNILENLDRWEPDVSIRAPEGTDIVNPKPEYNHFAGLFVFHRPSSTLHIDDTVGLGDHPGFLGRLLGQRDGKMSFHPMLTGPGLLPDADAPSKFRCFIEAVVVDWKFENLVAAHRGIYRGGAHVELTDTVQRYLPTLQKLALNRASVPKEDMEKFKEMWSAGHTECG